MGDTALDLQYQFLHFQIGKIRPDLSMEIAETLPTGNYDHLGSNESGALGSGLLVTTISILGQELFWAPNGRIWRGRFNVSYSSRANAWVQGKSIYGNDANFSGRVFVKPIFNAILATEYSLSEHLAAAIDLFYTHSGSSFLRESGNIIQARVTVAEARFNFGFAPALEYNLTDRVGIIGGANCTLISTGGYSFCGPAFAINALF